VHGVDLQFLLLPYPPKLTGAARALLSLTQRNPRLGDRNAPRKIRLTLHARAYTRVRYWSEGVSGHANAGSRLRLTREEWAVL
jgi:hypothetical protein